MKRTGRLRDQFPLSWRDTAISIAVLLAAAGFSGLFRLLAGGEGYAALIFLLAVLLISRYTNGYFYGTTASLISVLCVNYLFTYPYQEFNFSISGYPITFLCMFAVSIVTCTLTTRIKGQEKMNREVETEKMRSNLLRAVSHDLRTPLTSIVGASSAILENEAALTPEERRELLCEVREDAEWLIRMVENLLSITKIGAQPTRIYKQPEAAEEIMAEALRKLKKHEIPQEVSVHVPEELLMVPMDAILIEQVILNLLENAVYHSKTATRIDLCACLEGSDAVFEVRDNGAGIAPEVLPHLFDGYFTHMEENSGDRSRHMGIGLSVCMTIIRAHGGTMTAENLPTGGAVFRFSLPLGGQNDKQ